MLYHSQCSCEVRSDYDDPYQMKYNASTINKVSYTLITSWVGTFKALGSSMAIHKQ